MALSHSIRPLLAAIVGTCALVAPALAQVGAPPPVSENGTSLVLDAMGHSFAVPFPDWLNADQLRSGNVMALVDATFRINEVQALLEIYPKGETEALWKTLYGASITLTPDQTLREYRDAVMTSYSRTCKPELTVFFQLTPDDGENLAPLGFVCGGYNNRLTAYAGLGEVMLMSFRKSDKGVGFVYEEWRGPAFDPAVPSSWPVDTRVVESRAAQLGAEPVLTLVD